MHKLHVGRERRKSLRAICVTIISLERTIRRKRAYRARIETRFPPRFAPPQSFHIPGGVRVVLIQ